MIRKMALALVLGLVGAGASTKIERYEDGSAEFRVAGHQVWTHCQAGEICDD